VIRKGSSLINVKTLSMAMLLTGCIPKPPVEPPVEPPSNPDGKPALKTCYSPSSMRIGKTKLKGCRGSKRLMVLLNGTGASCSYYNSVRDSAVRKGYIVACPESKNTGSGDDGVQAYKDALSWGESFDYVLVTGHSQGGMGAVATASKLQNETNLIIETLPMQPAFFMNPRFRSYARDLTGYKVVVCGSRDTIVPCSGVKRGYDSLKDPKEFITISAGHLNPMRRWSEILDKFD